MDKMLKDKTKLHVEKNYPINFLRNFIPSPKKNNAACLFQKKR